MTRARVSRCVGCAFLASLALAGCGGTTIPEANKSLRPVPLTAQADLEAYRVADAVDDQLRVWCDEARTVRESGEALAADNPVVDGRAAAEVERLRAAAESAASYELATALREFAAAHEDRLSVLRRGRKFAAKRYLRAERRVAELAFGLRRWRLQR